MASFPQSPHPCIISLPSVCASACRRTNESREIIEETEFFYRNKYAPRGLRDWRPCGQLLLRSWLPLLGIACPISGMTWTRCCIRSLLLRIARLVIARIWFLTTPDCSHYVLWRTYSLALGLIRSRSESERPLFALIVDSNEPITLLWFLLGSKGEPIRGLYKFHVLITTFEILINKAALLRGIPYVCVENF